MISQVMIKNSNSMVRANPKTHGPWRRPQHCTPPWLVVLVLAPFHPRPTHLTPAG